ncbi:MAG TPA: hypothetical protein VMV90_03550 [Rectinemataceae bacterium]|nr:hypothetical protein [Rectinemataceae bacterium]
MVVVVTAKGAGLGAWIDDSFAASRQVVVVHENGRFDAIANPFPEDPTGKALADLMVSEIHPFDALVTGDIRTDALDVFLRKGVMVYQAKKGSVMELADSAADKSLPAAAPNE